MVKDAAERGYSALECNDQEWKESLPVPQWMGQKPWNQWKCVTSEMEKKGFRVVQKEASADGKKTGMCSSFVEPLFDALRNKF